MEKKNTGKRIKMEEGGLPIPCPRCGTEMVKCPQTTEHSKNRQTEAVVYECSDEHRCKEVVIVTKKVVNIRKAKRTKTLSTWPNVKSKDLKF